MVPETLSFVTFLLQDKIGDYDSVKARDGFLYDSTYEIFSFL